MLSLRGAKRRGNPPVEWNQVTISTKKRNSTHSSWCFSAAFPSNRGIATTSVRTGLAMTDNLQRTLSNTNLHRWRGGVLGCGWKTTLFRSAESFSYHSHIKHFLRSISREPGGTNMDPVMKDGNPCRKNNALQSGEFVVYLECRRISFILWKTPRKGGPDGSC